MKKSSLPVVSMVALLLLFISAVIGWGFNLYDLIMGCVHFTAGGNYMMLALRAVGVFIFPLGSFLGLVF